MDSNPTTNKEVIWTFTPDPKPSNTHTQSTSRGTNSNNSSRNDRSNHNNNDHHASSKRSRSSSNSPYSSQHHHHHHHHPQRGHRIVQAGKGYPFPPPPPSYHHNNNQPFRSSYNHHGRHHPSSSSSSFASSLPANHRSAQSLTMHVNRNKHEVFHPNPGHSSSSSHPTPPPIPWRHARTLAREAYVATQAFEHEQEEDQNEDDDELLDPSSSVSIDASSLRASLPRVPKHENPILQHYTAGYASLPSKCALLRLHEEILDFAAFVTPSPSEHLIACQALKRINVAILQNFPNAKIEIFGSRMSNLVLPTSDWDIALFGVAGSSPNMYKLAREMEKQNLVSKTEVITTARVPIVKLWEKQSGIQIDISFEAKSALVSRSIIQTYLTRYPIVRPLVLVLKYYLLQRGLNDTFSGGIGSFLLVLMVVHVVSLKLQEHHPQPQPQSQPRYPNTGNSSNHTLSSSSSSSSVSSINLGLLLVSIFEYYGFNLNTQDIGISVLSMLRPSNLSTASSTSSSSSSSSSSSTSSSTVLPSLETVYYSKRSRNWYDMGRETLLSIENPSDTSIDAGKNSWAMDRIKRSFRITHVNLARVIRQYDQQFNSYPSSSVTKPSFSVNHPTVPESILTSVIRIDTLLRERAIELFEHQNPTEQQDEEKSSSDEENDSDEDSVSSDETDATLQPRKRTKTRDTKDEATSETKAVIDGNKEVSGSSLVHSTTELSSGTTTTLSPSTATTGNNASAKPTNTEDISRKVQNELENQAKSSGIVLRHSRLLADIMTRKERGVEALALQAPQYGTY